MYGFRNIQEMEKFFQSPEKSSELHKYLENQEIFTFSHHSIIKQNATQLFNILIDNAGQHQENTEEFEEIKNFKKKRWH